MRGFRIDLGEIEANLRQHEAVGEAVVTVRKRSGFARPYMLLFNSFKRLSDLQLAPDEF